MKERPILFSAPMVRAIIEGRKTQTRRVIKPQPDCHAGMECMRLRFKKRDGTVFLDEAIESLHKVYLNSCPYGQLGDRLYVKEATWLWCKRRPNGKTKTGRPKWHYVWQENTPPVYVADHPEKPIDDIPVTNRSENRLMWKYKTARFMPKKAVRITLEITDVRVQRLQEISEEDAIAEGTPINTMPIDVSRMPYPTHIDCGRFAALWDSINAKRYHGWDANDWVWALTFKRVQP